MYWYGQSGKKFFFSYFLQMENSSICWIPTQYHTLFQIICMAILYGICYYFNFLDEENETQGNLTVYLGYVTTSL